MQGQDGYWRDYPVTGTAIADARLPWQIPALPEGRSALTLVTCWPLDAILPGGPLRYLVFAEEIPSR